MPRTCKLVTSIRLKFADDSTIHDIMSSLLFTIAHTAPSVTPIIKLRYATQGDVRKIMSDTKMEFAPGLREVLMSDSPPTLDFI